MPNYKSTFLSIDGNKTIKGTSTDSKHKEWIDIHQFESHISGEGNYNSQKEKTWRASHSDMTVKKSLDQTSPKLAEAASLGTPFEEVVIQVCEILDEKKVYMTYKMSKVVIVAYNVKGSLGVPLETIAFRYEKIQWTYESGFVASWTIPQNQS